MTKRRRNWRLAIAPEALDSYACELVSCHEALKGQGYQLGGRSGMWRTKHGLYTARFVYRSGNNRSDLIDSIVFTIRNIAVEANG